MLYSSNNKVTAKKELALFNYILKLDIAAHEECTQYLEEEHINKSNEWLDWGNVHSCSKETNNDDRSLKVSSKTKSHSSRSSRKSSKSSSSSRSKSDRRERKVKLTKLLVQEDFSEKCQQVENKAQRLRMQEKLAKARARAQILENMEFGEEQGLHGEMLVYRQQSLYFRQTKKENFKVPTVNKIVIFWIKHTKLNKKRKGFHQRRTLFGALCHLVKQQSDIELDVFDKNPLDFHYFMTPMELWKKKLVIHEKNC